ncbi:HAD family phosphatase [Candidatus Peregrinibacteria bacterium]|nr:HAD family phosphatase [Candidatus Peregrinibacteria bacterium]
MKVYFWDMDGGLIDSLQLDLDVVNPWLKKRFGCKAQVSKEFIASKFALAIPEFCKAILKKVGEYDDQVCTEMVKEYDQLREETVFTLCPGVRGCLEGIQAKGDAQWVVSNNMEKSIIAILEKVGLKEFFDRFLGYDSAAKIVKKPAPDIYLNAFNKAIENYPKAEKFLVFEDSEIGLQAALKAQKIFKKVPVQVIAVATGGDLFGRLKAGGADLVLPNLKFFNF